MRRGTEFSLTLGQFIAVMVVITVLIAAAAAIGTLKIAGAL